MRLTLKSDSPPLRSHNVGRMQDSLLTVARRFAQAYSDPEGVARTAIPGLTVIRSIAPTELSYAISRPLICVVLQGSKQVMTGPDCYAFGGGDSLVVTADVPTVSQITRASVAAPYLSVVCDLDPALIAALSIEMTAAPIDDGTPVRVEQTDVEVADAMHRLLRIVERPSALTVLQAQTIRELHYWLLSGRHGPAIRRLGLIDSHSQRIARAVKVLRVEFTQPLRVERLAAEAGMSSSSFHQHFRSVTSLSPLQFQKQLRLIEARRLMLADGISSSTASFAVGYESVPQFTREYGRMFGQPPVRDIKAARHLASAEI